MSTIVKPLDAASIEILHGINIGACLDGECYAFAIALHRAFGWPIVGLMAGSVIRHALVRDPMGTLWDVRGRLAPAEVGEPFSLRPPYDLRTVAEADLRAVRPVDEHSIMMARKLSEYVWPDLPWNGEARRMKRFADELEALSRKYGIWIRAQFPAAQPVLSEAFGEEKGYTLTPTANAGGYMIDRRLD